VTAPIPDDVCAEMARRLARFESPRSIAAAYGVSPTNVGRIVARWKARRARQVSR
jgi:hypothetical protein